MISKSQRTGNDATSRERIKMGLFLVSYVEVRPYWPMQIPNKRKKEESEILRRERGQIKFIDLGL